MSVVEQGKATRTERKAPVAPVPGAPLLEIRDLHVEFRTREGIARAVTASSYTVGEGETLAVLGESGSGKRVTAQALMGILETPPGFVTERRGPVPRAATSCRGRARSGGSSGPRRSR